jgi:hypothetical protein
MHGRKASQARRDRSGRADSNRRPPAPKPESARIIYLRKEALLLVRANIASNMCTFGSRHVPLVLLPRCYLRRISASASKKERVS